MGACASTEGGAKKAKAAAPVKAYVPETALEARMIKVLQDKQAARKAAGEDNVKFVKIQLQFGKIAKAFKTAQAIFSEYDDDGNGTIELGELKDAVGKLGADIKDEDVKAIFDTADVDDSAALDYKEFLTFLCVGFALEIIPQDDKTADFVTGYKLLMEAFFIFDLDNDGTIVKEEAMSALKTHKSEANVFSGERFDELDADKNGHVVFSEFATGFIKWIEYDMDDDEEEEEEAVAA